MYNRSAMRLSEFDDCNRSTLYRAIQSVRKPDLNLTGSLVSVEEGRARHMNEVRQRGDFVIRDDLISRDHGLSERHAMIVGALLAHGELGIAELEALVPGVARRTLHRDSPVPVRRRVPKKL